VSRGAAADTNLIYPLMTLLLETNRAPEPFFRYLREATCCQIPGTVPFLAHFCDISQLIKFDGTLDIVLLLLLPVQPECYSLTEHRPTFAPKHGFMDQDQDHFRIKNENMSFILTAWLARWLGNWLPCNVSRV
ncbi:hypothetical protein SFRURICE_006229, partial [Spodoptera frugiperda]